MADDTIRLGLDVGDVVAEAKRAEEALHGVVNVGAGFDTLATAQRAATDASASLAREAKKTADVMAGIDDAVLAPIEETTRATTDFQDALERLDRVLKVVHDDELAFGRTTVGATTAVATSTKAVGVASANAAGRQKELARGALMLSQQLQDAAQGGLASMLNGVDGITQSFARAAGVSASKAALISGAALGIGTAALIAGPHVKQLFSVIFEGSNNLPTATDAFERLNAELKMGSQRLEELKGKQTLTNAELAEYNRLLVSTAATEKAVGEERERQAKVEAARKAEKESGLDKDAAAVAKDAVKRAGGFDKTVEEIVDNTSRDEMRQALLEEAGKWSKAHGNTAAARVEFNRLFGADIEAVNRGESSKMATDIVRKRAQDLVLGAIAGDATSADAIHARNADLGFGDATQAAANARREQQKRNQTEQRNYERRQEIREEADAQADTDWRDAEAAFVAAENAEEAFVRSKARRFAKYRDEMAAASKSTPEEERLSEAMDAIDARGVHMSDAERLKASQAAVQARDRGLSGRRAIDMGIRAVGDDRAKAKNAADIADDERKIDAATGGQLSYDQIQDATKRMRQLVGQGFNPMTAMQTAVNELVQTQGEFINKVFSINSGMNALASQARFQKQQVRGMRQMEPSYLSRGGAY